MNLYVETSAVLSWLFGEAAGPGVATILQQAQSCTSSDLTLIECDRALHRAVALDGLSEATTRRLRGRFSGAVDDWNLLRLAQPIIARARQPFPEEPIRTLDALHVASAEQARTVFADIILLSLDARVRKVAIGLGFPIMPA